MVQIVDQDGQPINRRFNAKRITDRSIDELLGICKGIIADKTVNQQEAEFIFNWLRNNNAAVNAWPGNIIAARIAHHLEDGLLDKEESADLLQLIQDVAGEKHQTLIPTNMSTSCFDKPQPTLVFPEKSFCLTGKFAMGPRKSCEQEVIDLGGVTTKNILKSTDYLVIGSIGSTDWIHTSFGRKIERAKELQAEGLPIAIISEDHWAEHF
ncbi:MAG: hypothetical protein KAT62_00555 [Desulfuromonadales bacterium]|nr:hypothetical protein [Desulfuromonadales bacterium]